ncbi:Lymphocyte function-associated antigen 3 [Dissostichus eleginoides]|uniref:Lymphocyte function-associated antigen 3 n=1 Tax=Dissostichus eleginoides TaxID=100907 RepID=A0AAD9FL35_DISEL|nr:Lymphocyte function-associated antigen 3 [Dissostichus eleginoides]
MARRYFLTYFTLTSCLVAGQSPEYALQGGEVSLKPDFTGHPDGILWKHKGNKVVEFNGREEQFYKPFENRITLDWISADIQITDLRFEDSGEYELELELNKKLQRFFYQLEVIDKIAKPIISCEINDDSIVNISGKLLCSAKPGRLQSDCYPVKSPSVGLIAGLVSFFCILLLVALLVLYCKLRHKACFAKDDPEKQSRVVPKKESTLRSNQPLRNLNQDHNMDNQEDDTPQKGNIKGLIRYHEQKNSGHIYGSQRGSKKTASPRSPLPAFSQDQNNLGDEDADREHLEEKIQLGKATNSEEAEPNPADVSDVPSEETQSDLELSVPEQTENNTEEHEKTASPPSPRHNESPSLDQSNVGAEDADQHRELAEEETPQVHNSDSETEDPDTAGVTDVPREETQSDLESSIVPEQPEKNTDQHEKTASPPSPTHRGSASSLDQSHVEDEDADQHRGLAEEKVPQCDPSDSEKADPDPAVVKDVPREETQSDLESSIVPEQPEPEKKDDKAEGMQSAPASAEPFSPAQPPEDSTFGHKEDANSQVTKETKEKNVRESDSSGEEERNESDDSTEDQQSPTLPEHKVLETTLHEQDLKAAEEETHTSKDNKQEVSETVKPVSEDGNKTESVGDCKETDKEPDLYLATSQQSQSPTPSNTFQESPDTAGAEPDQEEEEQKGHDKSKVQSDKDKGDAVEDKHEVECGLKEEKPGNESLSEDEEEQKKDKVVA